MKRVLCGLLCIVLLAGCGGEQIQTQETEEPEQLIITQEEASVTVYYSNVFNDYYVEVMTQDTFPEELFEGSGYDIDAASFTGEQMPQDLIDAAGKSILERRYLWAKWEIENYRQSFVVRERQELFGERYSWFDESELQYVNAGETFVFLKHDMMRDENDELQEAVSVFLVQGERMTDAIFVRGIATGFEIAINEADAEDTRVLGGTAYKELQLPREELPVFAKKLTERYDLGSLLPVIEENLRGQIAIDIIAGKTGELCYCFLQEKNLTYNSGDVSLVLNGEWEGKAIQQQRIRLKGGLSRAEEQHFLIEDVDSDGENELFVYKGRDYGSGGSWYCYDVIQFDNETSSFLRDETFPFHVSRIDTEKNGNKVFMDRGQGGVDFQRLYVYEAVDGHFEMTERFQAEFYSTLGSTLDYYQNGELVRSINIDDITREELWQLADTFPHPERVKYWLEWWAIGS